MAYDSKGNPLFAEKDGKSASYRLGDADDKRNFLDGEVRHFEN